MLQDPRKAGGKLRQTDTRTLPDLLTDPDPGSHTPKSLPSATEEGSSQTPLWPPGLGALPVPCSPQCTPEGSSHQGSRSPACEEGPGPICTGKNPQTWAPAGRLRGCGRNGATCPGCSGAREGPAGHLHSVAGPTLWHCPAALRVVSSHGHASKLTSCGPCRQRPSDDKKLL